MTKKELEQKTDSFVSKYLGQSKGYPDDSLYKGECLSICKLFIKEVFGISPPPSGTNSAYGYWSNFPNPLGEVFEKVLNTDDLIPQKGWIAIWQPWPENSYGHIAIVADGCTKTILKNWAQNWTSKTFQLESNKYTNVIGYLKPKSIIEDMTDNEKILLGLINENGLSEGDIRWLVDLKKNQTVPNLEKKVSDLESSLKDLTSRLEILESENKANNDLILSYQSTITSAKNELEEKSKEIQIWKSRYENKLKETPDKLSAFELIKLGLIKLLFKK